MSTSLVTPEFYADLCATTVAVGGYTAASGVLNVTSTALPFSQTNQFHFAILDVVTLLPKALGKATALNSSTQWVVTMSLDANANSTDIVVITLGTGSMNQIRSDLSMMGTYANLPSTVPVAGTRYKCTDGPYEFISTGSIWQAFAYGVPVTPPASVSGFSWMNQGTTSYVDTNGTIFLTNPGANTTELHVVKQALPTFSTFAKLILGWQPLAIQTANCWVGICVTDGTKLIVSVCVTVGALNIQWLKCSNVTTTVANYITGTGEFTGPVIWEQVEFIGGNLVFSMSTDRVNWIQIYSTTATDYLTATAWGFHINNQQGTAYTNYGTLIDFSVTYS